MSRGAGSDCMVGGTLRATAVERMQLPHTRSSCAMKRREFLATTGVGLAGAMVLPRWASARAPRAIGLQLYTLRNEMQKDFDGTLQQVAAIGYKQVEFAGYFDHPPEQVRATLDKVGLTSPSAHMSFDVTAEKVGPYIDAAHKIGHEYLIFPWLPP